MGHIEGLERSYCHSATWKSVFQSERIIKSEAPTGESCNIVTRTMALPGGTQAEGNSSRPYKLHEREWKGLGV